jgi:transcriptional regulator with XRE-family HTH domain
MSESKDKPFASLGAKLKLLRERNQESLEDASGAAEIDPPMLEAFENGLDRPAEDILHVLLHHFDASEDLADEVWELAGYKGLGSDESSGKFQPTPAMFVLPIDGRILYSDSVQVSVNDNGVTLNFMQNAGPDGKAIPVSRIGMSKEHAETMIKLMADCLNHSGPKQLRGKNPTDKQG